MNIIQQWLTDITSLPEFNTSNWLPYHYKYNYQVYTHTELRTYLASLSNINGYVTTPQKHILLNQSKLELDTHVLYGELFTDGLHLILQYQSKDEWAVHLYYLENCENNIEYANCLAERVVHLRTQLKVADQAKKHAKTMQFFRIWEPANNQHEDCAPVCRIALLTHIEF